MAKTTYVLIPGAWHGAWCWRSVIPLLERAGHQALAPLLLESGAGSTGDSKAVKQWIDLVCTTVESEREPVVLVGHSRGGMIASQVAERLPRKIRCLVYINGFLLRSGQSILRILRDDGTSPLLGHVTLTEDGKSWLVDEDEVEALFYGECARADIEYARSRLMPEPAAAFTTPARVTEQLFGQVPRIYIACLRDRAVPPALQKRMYTASPCKRVIALDADHSPFFSAPDELAGQLIDAASEPE